ncbi:unnamed protein product [Echinostoma caproni]|uniref:Uncharacterized protein n=1 Tax=Echinostoma caproni TaxID=27848 RepID=A0A183A2B0_9TREM|nr:unnamed protein product [Echinostoma caproni]
MPVYNPIRRISPSDALGESCFDELRELGSNGALPNLVRMPPHLLDPNPSPSAPLATTPSVPPPHELNSITGAHGWPAQDPRYWHGSGNKMFGDLSGLDKKGNKQSGIIVNLLEIGIEKVVLLNPTI